MTQQGGLTTTPESNIVEGPAEALIYVGHSFEDPVTRGRQWTVTHMLMPLPGRRLDGKLVNFFRARVQDAQGTVSFINQRDLELLLERAKTGNYCPLTGGYYPGINDPSDGWVGLWMDPDDEEDDLQVRELCEIRPAFGGWLPRGMPYYQRVLRESGEKDRVKTWEMGPDCDPVTGYGPDSRRQTINSRWLYRDTKSGVPWTIPTQTVIQTW